MRKYATPSGKGETIIRISDEEKEIFGLGKEKKTRYISGVKTLSYLIKFSRPGISNIARYIGKTIDIFI